MWNGDASLDSNAIGNGRTVTVGSSVFLVGVKRMVDARFDVENTTKDSFRVDCSAEVVVVESSLIFRSIKV